MYVLSNVCFLVYFVLTRKETWSDNEYENTMKGMPIEKVENR